MAMLKMTIHVSLLWYRNIWHIMLNRDYKLQRIEFISGFHSVKIEGISLFQYIILEKILKSYALK